MCFTSQNWSLKSAFVTSDVILLCFILANRLTVAVSDVLNPNIDDVSRGLVSLGCDGVQSDFSPQVLPWLMFSFIFTIPKYIFNQYSILGRP